MNNLIKKKKTKKTSAATKKRESKKGLPSKKAQTLLAILQDNYKLEPIGEFVAVYSDEQILYQELMLKYKSEKKRVLMTAEELERLWYLHKEIKDSHKTLIKYSYPIMRAMELTGDTGKAPIFNITVVPTTTPDGSPVTAKMINIIPTKPAPITENSDDS